MLLQLTGFIFDCTCIILPTPIVHIDNYGYLYYSTLFSPFTALYFILHLSYTLKKGHFENKPFIHSFIHSFILAGKNLMWQKWTLQYKYNYVPSHMGARRNFSSGGGGKPLGGAPKKSVKGGPHFFRQALKYAYRG